MHKYFGQILVENGVLTENQVQEALKLQHDNNDRKLGEILVTLNFIKYDDIIATLKKQFKESGVTPPGIERWLDQGEVDKIIKSIKK